VKDSTGRVVGASKIARDISAKKEAERALATGARQQKALFHLADELHRAASLEQVYSAALNAILDSLQCNRASILLCDDSGIMRFQSWRGLSSEYRAAVDGHSAWRKDEPNPQPVCIHDLSTANFPEALKAIIRREGIGALAFIPLMSDGKLIGKFMVYFNTPHEFSEDEIEVSLTIARQLAFAIERRRNDEALRQSEARLRKLSETLDAEVLRQTRQLRRLSHDLLRAQDKERRHIARELHDSAGQTLTVIGLTLDQIVTEATRTGPPVAKRLEEVQGLVQQLHREIRTTSYLLHPPLLDESGLAFALNWYVQGLAERSGIAVTLDMPNDFKRLPDDLELAIFRFVQECLTNVHRHSGSSKAEIHLSLEGEGIQVLVADSGKGMSPERIAEIQSSGSGVGVRGMQERIRQFGGTMQIQSSESGTRVFAMIPIPKDLPRDEVAPLEAAV
jgi:signal transduction histidine kinase